MKTILATTYALNPYKGSEDGMGWNFIYQIARKNKVFAVTRKNNQEQIEKYMNEFPDLVYGNITFLYYDLPYWMRFWKRGPKGAMPYYYLWQLFIPIFILCKRIKFDLAHNINFHNDWTPSLLWTLGKPFVWGPVGHHPRLKKEYIEPFYGKKATKKDRIIWLLKKFFWTFDPLLKLTAHFANHIWIMNSSVKEVFPKHQSKMTLMPSVASENVPYIRKKCARFHVLSIGRLVPLKGFDLTIRAFARFYFSLPKEDRKSVVLTIIGDGPELDRLVRLAKKLSIDKAIKFKKWMERRLLSEYYDFSGAFLFPSHEGAGMVIAEALSHGLPVVCLDNYGPGEFVTKESGFKVPMENLEQTVNDLAVNIMKLYSNENLWNKMSLAARRQFENKFDWNTRSKELDSIYNDILNSYSISKFKFNIQRNG